MLDKLRWVAIAFILPTALAFTACGVNFNPPWFAIPSTTNPLGYLFVVDANGNVFLGANNAETNASTITPITNSLMVYSNPLAKFVFGLNADYLQTLGSIYQQAPSIPEENAWVFKSGSGAVASITTNGDVYAKGYAVYSGAQAACPPDTKYCDTTSGDIYITDYYCNSSTWTCASNTYLYQDCNDYAYDSDGNDITVQGTCVDYNNCSAGETFCPYIKYTDTCVGTTVYVGLTPYTTTVREYLVDSTGTACTYIDVNVLSCKYGVDPKTLVGTAYISVCSGGKETIVTGGCCTDSDCPNIPYSTCDTGIWECQNYQCTCVTNIIPIV